MIRALRTALRFLTRVPVPGPPTAAGDLPAATVWFAPVGAGAALLIGAAHVQLTGLWPAPVAAILAVAFGLLLTGALHEDASADAADALGGARDRESLRRILGDSRLGTYGACALWLVLALRVAALVLLAARAPAALALAMAWGRASAMPLMRALPGLHDGAGRDLARGLRRRHLAGAAITLAVASAATWPWLGAEILVGVAAAIVAIGAWYLFLRARVGAQNGDLLGAGNQLVETAVLLALLAEVPA